MYEAIILIEIPDILNQKRLNATVDIHETPEFVENRLVEGNSKNYAVEYFERLFRSHKQCWVCFSQSNGCLWVEVVFENRVFFVDSFSEYMTENLWSGFEIQNVNQLVT